MPAVAFISDLCHTNHGIMQAVVIILQLLAKCYDRGQMMSFSSVVANTKSFGAR